MFATSRRQFITAAALSGLVAMGSMALVGCGSDSDRAGSPSGATAPAETVPATSNESSSESVTLRLGYFANITHATALVGVQRGIFAEKLGPNVKLKPSVFKAGGDVVTALFADALDASYVGPNPAINGFIKSKGDALRIISGATSRGAFLVVRASINSPEDLKGAKIATPQLGNTQDVALRAWLKGQGLSADTSGGGDVSILPQENAATLDAFKSGQIDGAWVPEPWATRLIIDGGGKVLVDERDLWPNGQYVTTQLVVSTKFLNAYPDVVKRLIEGHVAANDFVNANPTDAQAAANAQIKAITGKTIAPAIIVAAWKNLTFTNDPIVGSLLKTAEEAEALGFIKSSDLTGIYDLSILNSVLSAAGKPTVSERP
ncbi:unannotated protein [freshwater metagenome]|uniref:Unannotated protein n=1 Tax=freshwater metagenome TaxID=449393 RepID=A0A6J6VWP8_9ZZZZ